MAIVTPATEFAEILESLEPRAPLMLLEIDHEFEPTMAFDKTVRVRLSDAMHCTDIAEWYVDPISALHLVAKASRFVIDGEMQDDDADFMVELYNLCNARFAHYAAFPPAPAPTVVNSATIQFGDMVQLMREAIDHNGGRCGVELDGARWEVS